MKCMICGSPATIFITEMKNGKTTQKFLCENCARKIEENSYRQSRAQERNVKEAVCPKCKTRLSEFLKTGFLGCPDCYTAFGSTINSLMPKIQGNGRHVPRSKNSKIATSKEEMIQMLKAEMEQASKEMRYDDAEKIFKQLQGLGEV